MAVHKIDDEITIDIEDESGDMRTMVCIRERDADGVTHEIILVGVQQIRDVAQRLSQLVNHLEWINAR